MVTTTEIKACVSLFNVKLTKKTFLCLINMLGGNGEEIEYGYVIAMNRLSVHYSS